MGKWILATLATLALTSLRAQEKSRTLCDPGDAKNGCPGLFCVCTEEVISVTIDDLGSSVLELTSHVPGLTVEAAVVLDVKSPTVQGWSYGVRHDPSLITLVSVTSDGTDAAPVFQNSFVVTLQNDIFECAPGPDCRSSRPGSGFIQTVALGFAEPLNLALGRTSVAMATYRLREIEPELRVPGILIELTDRLQRRGSLPISVVLETGSRVTQQPRTVVDGWITWAGVEPAFRRGDPNGDGNVNIADAVSLLLFLFVFGPAPGCLEAADFDDDGRLDGTDPILILRWLFLEGSAPAPPGAPPAPCGRDPGGDGASLGCEVYEGC